MSVNVQQRSIKLNGFDLMLAIFYRNQKGNWVKPEYISNGLYKGEEIEIKVELTPNNEFIKYKAEFSSNYESQVHLSLEVLGENNIFHLIPCNIHGDNNAKMLRANEMPILAERDEADIFKAPLWEFRADRASHPVSVICCDKGAVGVSIQPYFEGEEGLVRNGVFSELPNVCGVSLGYTNDPVTFLDKKRFCETTSHKVKNVVAKGKIFAVLGDGRLAVHTIIKDIYSEVHEPPTHQKTYKQAAEGLVRAYNEVNWSDEFQEYSNLDCKLPTDTKLKSWRPLVEIGWTGGGIIAYPFMLARQVLGLDNGVFKKTPERILNEICGCYNPQSGLLNDVTRPSYSQWPQSPVNGWWTGFGLVEDKHCAYTNGSALYYILKSYIFAKKYGYEQKKWLETTLQVLNTVISLQRTDGAFGYSFDIDKKCVDDWDGFAGCWFAAVCALAYKETKDEKYLVATDKALDYYHTFVKQLNCYGTPMDTWKSIDEEGNLAFIKASREMHEATGSVKYLDMAVDGANYEYLWRYSFKAKPEFLPLKGSSFNSCGGSVTSISNPHIHPMGLIVTEDLIYISKATADDYHMQRAMDGLLFGMNILELYPETSGYGTYGVLTERYCPSDGLTIEQFDDGAYSSMWFSYNGWAAANTLEAICEIILQD